MLNCIKTDLKLGESSDKVEAFCSVCHSLENKCSFCHDPYGTNTIVGQGHKGILKNQALPSIKKPATPENIANQLKSPYKDMPSFSYLSEDDVRNIIAFLNTL